MSCLFEIPPLFFIPHQGRRRPRNFSSLKHHPPPTPFLPPPSSSSVATVINRGGRWREGDEFSVLPQTPDKFLRRGFADLLLSFLKITFNQTGIISFPFQDKYMLTNPPPLPCPTFPPPPFCSTFSIPPSKIHPFHRYLPFLRRSECYHTKTPTPTLLSPLPRRLPSWLGVGWGGGDHQLSVTICQPNYLSNISLPRPSYILRHSQR